MDNKYLPIGTICTVKNKNRKYMIIGYYSLKYSGSVKMYDYTGYPYPEGKLLETEAIAFNHSDIVNVDYLGYKSDIFDNFNLSLLKPSINKKKLLKDDFLNNIKFDENGVVIYDGINSYDHPLDNQILSQKSNYEFDENGIVTLDNDNNENPFVHNYSDEDIISSNSEQPMFNNLVFDKNGVVVSDGTSSQPSDDNESKKYIFDEDGVVVSDETNSQTFDHNGSKKYMFDKNGIVVSDGTSSLSSDDTENKKYIFDEDGVVVSDSKYAESTNKINDSEVVSVEKNSLEHHYEFDENGIVVG